MTYGASRAASRSAEEVGQTIHNRAARLEQENSALKSKIESMEDALNDSSEMLGELVKLWAKKMPNSASDVSDQIRLNFSIMRNSRH